MHTTQAKIAICTGLIAGYMHFDETGQCSATEQAAATDFQYVSEMTDGQGTKFSFIYLENTTLLT